MADQNSSVTDTCSNSSSPVPLAANAPKYGTVIPNRIFVGGISFQTNDVELKNFFSTYGQVKEAKIITDRAGISKGYGFITFENPEEAVRIIKEQGNNLIFKDKKLNIGPAIRKQPVHYPKNVDTAFLPNGVVNVVQAPAGFTYTYLNGVAYFNPNEVGQTPVAHPSTITQHTHSQQPPAYSPYSVPVMMSHAPPQYMASQPQSYAFHQPSPTTPQWTTPPPNQWRPWLLPQSTAGSNPGHHGLPLHMFSPATPGSDVIYSAAPHYPQPVEVQQDMSVMDSSQSEGALMTMDQSYRHYSSQQQLHHQHPAIYNRPFVPEMVYTGDPNMPVVPGYPPIKFAPKRAIKTSRQERTAKTLRTTFNVGPQAIGCNEEDGL